MLFPAGLTCVLLRSEDKVILYDLQQKRSLAELLAPNIKYVFWSEKHGHVALMGKDSMCSPPTNILELANVFSYLSPDHSDQETGAALLYP